MTALPIVVLTGTTMSYDGNSALIIVLEEGDAGVTFPWVSSVTLDEFYCNGLKQATTAS